MPRASEDGSKARASNKRMLTKLTVERAKPEARRVLIHDTKQPGLALAVERSGHKSYKLIYRFNGRVRWYHIGDALKVSLKDARDIARDKSADVVKGVDVQAEKLSARKAGSFEELCERYIKEYAKPKLKAWKQSDKKVRLYLLPRWKHVQAAGLTRGDVRAMFNDITNKGSRIAANQAVAQVSAIYSWAIESEVITIPANPASGVTANDTKARERYLSDREIPLFWHAFDDVGLIQGSALRVILLTGQRPGEVRHMRWEDIEDGWWTMPGSPVGTWPGTKNKQTHRVWLSEAVLAILEDLDDDTRSGLVFEGARGRPIGGLDVAMRKACQLLKVNNPVRPHDLRRTHGTLITSLGFRRDQMNRIQNHKEGGIASVYDRHNYAPEAKAIQEAVAARIMALVEGQELVTNVVALKALVPATTKASQGMSIRRFKLSILHRTSMLQVTKIRMLPCFL